MKKLIKEKVKLIFQKNNHNPIEIAAAVVEFDGKHIEVDFTDKVLSYRRIISPKQGRKSFASGYFDNHYADINDLFFEQIKTQFQKCIHTISFEKELPLLPPGASRDAYMRYVDTKGISYYYSNVYLSENGFSVERTAVHEEFNAFCRLLSSQCFFQNLKQIFQIAFFPDNKN